MKKTTLLFLTILSFGGADAALALDDQVPVVQIPITSPSEIARRAPQAGEALPHYIDRVSLKAPAKIVMKGQASFDLPKDYLFVPDRSARVLLTEIDGARPSAEIMGLIFPNREELGYILFEYYPVGYVSDSNFKNTDLAQALTQMKNRIEAQNPQRRESRNPEIEVLDWLEKPNYVKQTNCITWSVLMGGNGIGSGVNYNAALLGRKGYFHALLVTNADSFKARRPEIEALLSTFEFQQGSRYSDFDSATDNVVDRNLDALLTAQY
jgi:uncharacterized membrane-anchored protein